MQREYLKSNLPLPVSSADDSEDDDGTDILIRRSASGVFRYSSPSISQSNTANNGCKKSITQQLQQRSSTNGEQCSNNPGEVISHTTTQGDGSSNSVTVSRHNMEPEKSARSDDGKSRMVVQGQPLPTWLTENLEEARTSGLGLHHHHSPVRRR